MSGIGHITRSVAATGNPLIDGILANRTWDEAVITYSFPTNGGEYRSYYSEASSFGAVTTTMQNTVRFAIEKTDGNAANDGFSVEGFTNAVFAETQNASAVLRFGVSNDPSSAWAYTPSAYYTGGDVWFGRNSNFTTPVAGDYKWTTALHEIGHALGLKHGHVSTDFGALPFDQDSFEYSIMTYRGYVGSSTQGAYQNELYGYPQTYMMADIAALQHQYGANYQTNNGDTVYKWTPTSGDTLVNGQVAITPGANRIFATIWDGGGVDTYDLSAYSTDLTVDLAPGGYSKFIDAQRAVLGPDQLARGNIFNALTYNGNVASLIENAVGGAGNDLISGNIADNTITGGRGADTLSGLSGDDVLIGGKGQDHLDGGEGDDTLIGGEGADTLIGGAGQDIADYSTATTRVNADLQTAAQNAFGSDATGDQYFSIENLRGTAFGDDLRGDSLNNLIVGGLGNDFVMGRDGDDTLIGGNGNDILAGGNGNDILNGGAGSDRLLGHAGDDRLVGATGNDQLIDFSGNNLMMGGAGADTLFDGQGDSILFAGDGNDRLIGSSGNDRLYGGDGNDTLNGGNGNDFLIGDTGRDYLVGGNGWDSFVFRPNNGADTIGDFQTNQDRLLISSQLAHDLTDATQIIQTYGAVTDTGLVFDFGAGNTITLAGYTDIDALAGSILIIA